MSKDLILTDEYNEDNAREAKTLALAMGMSADNYRPVMAAVAWGRTLGLAPTQSAANIHIIKGKPVLGASLLGSLVKQSGRYNYRVKAHTAELCTIEFSEKWEGEWEVCGVSTFTMADYKAAGISNANYQKYPRNMLFARAMSNGVKWYCPDVAGGAVYSEEEAHEITVVNNVMSQLPAAEPDITDAVVEPVEPPKVRMCTNSQAVKIEGLIHAKWGTSGDDGVCNNEDETWSRFMIWSMSVAMDNGQTTHRDHLKANYTNSEAKKIMAALA